MYESFYGLRQLPFRLTPDPSFLFESREHAKARAYLRYGLNKQEGFIVITGSPGAGKTALTLSVIGGAEASEFQTAYLTAMHFSGGSVVSAVCAALGADVRGRSPHESIESLRHLLTERCKTAGPGLVVVDDAHLLSDESLDGLRMMADLQSGARALLQVVLVGQTALRRRVLSPGMEQLAQRVTGMCHIGALDPQEIGPYVEHRLTVAGCDRMPEIEALALQGLHSSGGGLPRNINSLCDRLLLLGCVTERSQLTADDVRSVTDELEQEMALAVEEPEARSKF